MNAAEIRNRSRENYETQRNFLRQNLVAFQPHPLFEEFIIIDDTVTRLSLAVEKLDEAREIAAADSISLNEALQEITTEELPEFEYCTSKEWLRVYGGYEPASDSDNDEYDEAKFNHYLRSAEAAFKGVEFVAAKNQRSLCHGWNGAQFFHAYKGIGTFNLLTPAGESLFDAL